MFDFSSANGGPYGNQTLLDLFKLYLGIDVGDTTKDTELSFSLDAAGQICEQYIDRVIGKRPVEEYFQSYFGRVTLHNYPVDTAQDVTVTLNGQEQSDYEVYEERWRLPHLTRQAVQHDMPLDWRAYDRVVVSYTAGFDPIPSDLSQAIIYTAADIYSSQGQGILPGGGGGGSGAIKSMSIHDVGSITYDVGVAQGPSGGSISSFGVINETAAHLLHRYKRMAA